MKLLFDANLSPVLVTGLADIFPGSSHVFMCGDIAADDMQIWSFAAREGFAIVTKDTDFLDLAPPPAARYGEPPPQPLPSPTP